MNRRGFLQVSLTAGGGLLLGFDLFGCKSKKSDQPEAPKPVPIEPRQLDPQTPPTAGSGADLNAWIRIDPDGKVTLFIPEAEMGQGVLTSLPMILADELAAKWEDVSAVNAPLDEAKYGRQSTGGSTSIRTGVDQLRKAGAAARAMLIAAAAAEWKVDPSECVAEDGTVTHPGGKSAGYGELVEQGRDHRAARRSRADARRQAALHRQADAAPGHPVQDRRQRGVRHGRPRARHGLRLGRALPDLWRLAESGRRRRGAQGAGRARRGRASPPAWPWSPTTPGPRSRDARR